MALPLPVRCSGRGQGWQTCFGRRPRWTKCNFTRAGKKIIHLLVKTKRMSSAVTPHIITILNITEAYTQATLTRLIDTELNITVLK